MEKSRYEPRLHLFVCTHMREGSALGPGCGAAGKAVFQQLKAHVADRGEYGAVWVTETGCMGLCPKKGCTVAVMPAAQYFLNVTDEDAGTFLPWAIDRP
jgi:(2Fe-2S) ferredoxin